MKKFLIKLALVSVISGILSLLNCDDSLIQFVCSLIMIIVPTIIYIVTEGVLDYASIGLALEEVVEIINKYIEIKKEKELENKENNSTDCNTEVETNQAELKEGTFTVSTDCIIFD